MKIQFRNYLENLFFPKRKISNPKGFSLIEIIFSIGIIMASMISLLSLFSYNVRNEADNKNKLIAVYLSEEQIEIVRQLRDNNWFNGLSWLWDIKKGNDVIVSVNDTDDLRRGWETENIGGGSETKKKVYLNNNGSYIQYEGGIPGTWTYTGFDRYLTVEENNGLTIPECFGITDCVKITSHVYFRDNLTVETTAYLYDKWY